MRSLLALLFAACAAVSSAQSEKPKELDISGASAWTDTGIDLQHGDSVRITATGTLHFAGAKENGPEGLARGWMDLIRILPANEAGRGALIGRFGSNEAARPFLVGPRTEMKAPIDGRLFLGINAASSDQPDGSFHVIVVRTKAATSAAAASKALPKLTQEMLDGLDRFWRTRALIDINALTPSRRAAVLAFIREWAESAAGFSGEQVFRGFSQIPLMHKAAIAATGKFDYVLSPTAPMTAFPAEWASPSQDPLKPFPQIGFTVAFNMSEQPAASVNCGYDSEGLPIGLQIIGRRFDDLGVLAVARAFETIRAEQRPWPEPPAA